MNCTNCGAAMALVASRRYFHCGHCGNYHFPEAIEADGVRIVGQSVDVHKCPKCVAAMAHALLDDHDPIDFCARCRGILMPRTAFAAVTQRRRAWATSTPTEPSPLNREELRRRLACPKCGGTFDTYPHFGPGNVVLDNCTACDLIWLDFGEIRQIVDAPGRDRGTREVRRLDDDYVRGGADGSDSRDAVGPEQRDPLRLLMDILFG